MIAEYYQKKSHISSQVSLQRAREHTGAWVVNFVIWTLLQK